MMLELPPPGFVWIAVLLYLAIIATLWVKFS
jgi:hypothetical protein